MPGSSNKGKVTILEWRREMPPIKKILDVGPGWGTYIKLLKSSGEVWHAVEIHEPYVERFKLKKLYDKVFVGNIAEFEPADHYDLVILGDVLEHIEKQRALEVLGKVFSYAKFCLLSLPLDQETGVELDNHGEYWGNPYEKHLARWSNLDFLKQVLSLGGEPIAVKKYRELGVYLIACKSGDNFLNESVGIFDKLKFRKMTVDSGRGARQTIKYYILKLIPRFVKKFAKRK